MPLPNGTVTFLFTDIEGSTKLWEQQPQAMRSALARHDTLLRQAIESNNGYVFKTVGDAFCAAFSAAPDAVAAALAAQSVLHAEPWPDALSLRVRMALHTGAAELRDNDYFGQPLNRVARLLAIGYGGQVLVSAATQELTRDALPASSHLKDVGEHRLRDLGRSERVYQLLHPDLPSEFAPLKSLDNPDLPNNLPQQVTSFIGREKEIETVKVLLGQTRLLTLTGSGGGGKTRLGLQVAAEILENYPEGVWLVELAPLVDPALVPQAVTSVLGLREETGKPLVQTLVDFLKARRLLLVLDNCEHVLDACARLADALLKHCSQVQMLASSRESLGIAGEQTYRVPSLTLPDVRQVQTVGSVSQYEAVRLFIERALCVESQFTVTNASAPALAQLCVRLDGIPLALELAAARVRTLSVEEISTRLDNRFRLLTGGSRTALPRQQTLRALIDWSYDLLNAQEKTLLCRLSVFAGGWTLDAAEQVCTGQVVGAGEGIEDWEMLDLLTALVDKSLVVVEQVVVEQQAEYTRYRLLETVRQYARDRLVEREQTDAVRERHEAFFMALAEEAEPQLSGPQQVQWLHRLEREHSNLRAAMEWGYQGEAALRIGAALWRFWSVRGYFSEGREWLAGMLAGGEVGARSPVRAKALSVAGALASSQGDYATARTLGEESLAIHRELGNKRGISNVLHSLGIVASSQGDYTAACGLYAESLMLSRELGNKRGIANVLHSLGMIASNQGDYAAARSLSEESLAIYRELGNRRGIANVLHSLGIAASSQGDYTAARAFYEESLAIHQELGNRRGIANLLHGLGIVGSSQGDYKAAHTLNAESLAIHQELGNKRGVASVLHSLGVIAFSQGDYTAARGLYAESLTLSQELGNKRGIVHGLEALAALASVQDHALLAAQSWGAAEALREILNAPMPPSDRPRHDRQVAEARAALSPDAFDSAWAKGRGLTMEQATQYALEGTGG